MPDTNSPDLQSPPPSRRPSRLRNIALGMLLGTSIGLIGTIALLATLRGVQLPTIDFKTLDAAEGRWNSNAPRDYILELELSGVNPGTAHIEVRGGEVVAMTHDGRPTREHVWDNWSVPGLFAIIRRDLEVCMAAEAAERGGRVAAAERGAADSAPGAQADPSQTPGALQLVVPRGEFDPQYGYPVRYHRVTPTGVDAKWQVTTFKPK